MKRYTSKSIASYLNPFVDFARTYLKDEIVCIDRQGKLHTLSISDVRKFNNSYANTKTDELFGEKLSFIANYISFRITKYDGTYFYCDICEEIKPTDLQIEKLFELIKKIKKLYSDCAFDINWRWLYGGGNSLCCQRTPQATIRKITKALEDNKEWAKNEIVKYCDFIAEIKGEI